MTLRAVAADLRTGAIIDYLPSLDVQYPVRRTISNYDATTAVLHLAGAPTSWERCTFPGGTVIALYDDTVNGDGSQPKPIVWAGYIAYRSRTEPSADVELSLVTLEAYLNRRYVGDVTYTASQGRNVIVADIVNTNVIGGTGISNLQLSYSGPGPFPPAITAPPAGAPAGAALIFQNADNATALTRISSLFGLLGGEFTIDWAFTADNSAIVPTMRFGDRIGTAVMAGQRPNVTFEMPGTLDALSFVEDYSESAGANQIVAYSLGNDYLTVRAADFAGRPTFEERYSPGSALSPPTLAKYAQQAVAIRAPGKQTVTLTANTARTVARKVGVDWFLGDDIGYRVPATYVDPTTGKLRTVLAFPHGLDGVGRTVAYELSDTQVTPILADKDVYQEATA